MSMKFNKSSQLIVISVTALLVSTLLVACGSLTVDFVFVASSKAAGPNSYGQIDVMKLNSESGFLRAIPTSPFPSGGRNPVAEVVSPDSKYLYVVNRDDNTIVQFLIGSDGKVYPQSTLNTPGIFPLAMAIDPNNKFLYVVDTYQPLPSCSPFSPCSGSVAVFQILTGAAAVSANAPDGSLGAATYLPLTIGTDQVNPSAITVLGNGSYVYVAATDSTVTPPATQSSGYIFSFSVNPSATNIAGVLTPVSAQPSIAAGIQPSGITSVNNTSVYLTDGVNLAAANGGNNVYAYSVGSNGALSSVNQYAAGNKPSALVADLTGKYLYVTNSVDSNVSAFSILSNGALNNIGTYATGSQPVAILVDPRLGRFIFTANFLGSNADGTVSGFEIELNPPASSSILPGSLINTQASPYISSAQPRALAAVEHNGSAPSAK